MPLFMRLLALCFVLAGFSAFGQPAPAPFANEIKAFMQQDSAQPPQPGAVLFVGSSSIRLWPNLEQDFAGLKVLNRGFGGASIPDVARYAQQTIYRYRPAQIIFYCGENDLAASNAITADTVVQRFTQLFYNIRKALPGVPFVFISIKPSPSRAHLMPEVKKANNRIQQFLKKQPNTRFVDVYGAMLNENGRPRGELFGADSLHMNQKGYAIWKEKLKPVAGKTSRNP